MRLPGCRSDGCFPLLGANGPPERFLVPAPLHHKMRIMFDLCSICDTIRRLPSTQKPKDILIMTLHTFRASTALKRDQPSFFVLFSSLEFVNVDIPPDVVSFASMILPSRAVLKALNLAADLSSPSSSNLATIVGEQASDLRLRSVGMEFKVGGRGKG